MRKIILVAFIALILTGCSKGADLVDISYDDLAKKIQNKDSFVLYVGSSECSHCAEFRPKLEKVMEKYKLKVYYIDMSKVTTTKYNAVMKKVDGRGTPTTVYIKKGQTQVSPRIEGDTDEDTTIEFFKDLGLIKGE